MNNEAALLDGLDELDALIAGLDGDDIEIDVSPEKEDKNPGFTEAELQSVVNEVELEAEKKKVYKKAKKEVASGDAPTPSKKKQAEKPAAVEKVEKPKKEAAPKSEPKPKGKIYPEVLLVNEEPSEGRINAIRATIDSLPVKPAAKAQNLLAWYLGKDSLSVYLQLGLKFVQGRESFTIPELLIYLSDQSANGVKGYGLTTCRSQSHNITHTLLKLEVIQMIDSRKYAANPDSLIYRKWVGGK